MIASRDSAQKFSRTLRWLEEAESLIDDGYPAAAIMTLRSALDSVPRDAFGYPLDTKVCVTIIAVQAGCSRRLVTRLRDLRGNANGVVHSVRTGRACEARAMLRLFRVVGSRWLRRIYGAAESPVQPSERREQ